MNLLQLEQCIKRKAPPYYATATAPDTYKKLVAATTDPLGHRLNVIPVYNGESNGSIYSESEINFAFRAWHDKIHLDMGLDFSPMSEYRVALEHVRQAREYGVPEQQIRALWVDTFKQVEYYTIHRKYVDNQQEFLNANY